jgi:uncharacterized membrane-anchored protein
MAEVQTPAVSSSKDNALLILSIVAILGGIAAFYWYDELMLPLRIVMVVVGLAAGARWYGRIAQKPSKRPTSFLVLRLPWAFSSSSLTGFLPG